tara:strand:+ start:1853 stop:2959 length:1107 start_codon:yes stop_codon:yes gene_type:complete
MANMNVKTPRFYVDYLSYLLSRGITQNGNFDITATNTTTKFMGTFTTGSEPELFDMNPLNLVTFDTSADTDAHVLLTINKQDATQKINYIAILNHNLATSVGKIRIFAGDEATDVAQIDGTGCEIDSSGINWDNNVPVQAVNADTITVATGQGSTYNDKSVVIEPATNGTTIFTFAETNLQYWGIQFEGNTTNTGVSINGTWGSTDFSVGGIIMGEYYDMPVSPDLSLKRSISFDGVEVQESLGGQKYSNTTTHGRLASSTSKSPFSISSNPHNIYGGRLSYDMNFSYLASTDVMPDEYSSIQQTDDAVIEDVWNKTNGNALPFIFSSDNTSTSESDHIFARFDQNSLSMKQVALNTYNINLKLTEEM